MTLTKAVKVLGKLSKVRGTWTLEEKISAIKLGLEALKRERAWRQSPRCTSYDLLPGETKE